jgi:site-specific DNA-methyltransferase (adenine-specific)
VVLDPFGGSGTTAEVAMEEGRNAILCELNQEYIPLINERLSKVQPSLF